jgi:hypothetical protein
MPVIEEVPLSAIELTKDVENLGLNSKHERRSLDDESDDEFHDACDRASESGAKEAEEEFTESEILVSKSN